MRLFASNVNDQPHVIFTCVPHAEQPVFLEIEACIDIVQRCRIATTAVTFPSFALPQISVGEVNAYIEYTNTDSRNSSVLEEWRCYRSGEFRYRANFWELTDNDTQWRMRQKTIFPMGFHDEHIGLINIVSLSYRVTAAFVFAQRLLHAFKANVEEVKISLDGIAGFGIGRIDATQHFARPPIARSNDCVFRSVAEEGGQAFDPYALAAQALISISSVFAWETKAADFGEWLQDARELIARSG